MHQDVVATLPDEYDLPRWFTKKLRSDVELGFDGGKYVGNSEIVLAVRGIAHEEDEPKTVRLFAMKKVSGLGESHLVHVAQVDVFGQRLLRVGFYAVRTSDGNAVTLRYFGLIRKFYPDAKLFSAGPGEALVAKINGDIVAVVMPVMV